MKIKQSILDLINKPTVRTKIAIALGTGENSVALQMRMNNPDGRLTKMDALKAISEETGIAVDQILEQEKVSAK